MIKFLGYILLIIGLLGFIFFISYEGTEISEKEFWFVLSILIVTLGAYFIVKYKLKSQSQQHVDTTLLLQIANLKQTGEKIRITLDNCEIITRSYQQEIADSSFPSQIQMLDALYNHSRNYKSHQINQTYIVFLKMYGSITFKFISQPTQQTADSLKRYIDDQHGIDLYVDKQDPKNYFFDLPFHI